MYQQDLIPIGDSIALSALCALLPLVCLLVLIGGLKWKAQWAAMAALGVAVVVTVAVFGMPVGRRSTPASTARRWACSSSSGSPSTRSGSTTSPSTPATSPCCGALQHDQRRPAGPGARDRVRLRRAAGGARRRRCPGRRLRRDADRARIPPAQGGRRLPAGQHGTGRLRWHGQPDDGAGGGHRPARGGLCRDGRAPGPVPGPARAVRARLPRRRPARCARDLARRTRRRRRLRGHAVRGLDFGPYKLTDIGASLVSAAAIVLLLRTWSPAGPARTDVGGGTRPGDRRRRGHDPELEPAVKQPGSATRAATCGSPTRPMRSSSRLRARPGRPVKEPLEHGTWEFPWPGLDITDEAGEAVDTSTRSTTSAHGHAVVHLRPSDAWWR